MRWRAEALAAALCLALAPGAAQTTDDRPAGGADGGRDGGAAGGPLAGLTPRLREPPAPGTYPLPVRPARDAAPVETVFGGVSVAVYRLPGAGDSGAAVAQALEAQHAAQGWETRFRCAGADCGGFAFRAALWTAPLPAMRVSVADFHQVTMRRGEDALSVLASAAGGDVFVQIVTVTDARRAAAPDADPLADMAAVAAPVAPRPGAGADPGAMLDATGAAVLEGVDFRPGSLDFADGAKAALDVVARALRDRPGLSVVVVGHTDALGGLEVNRRVGARRAQAVVDALVARGVPAARLAAESAAWLAPRASNDTPEGRALNRRVTLVARP